MRLLPLVLLACAPPPDPTAPDGPAVRLEFAGDDLYGAPFPSDHRLVDGVVDLTGAPNPDDAAIVDQVLRVTDGVLTGWGTTSPVFLAFDELPETVPDVWLIGLDGPDRGVQLPIEVWLTEDPGPLATPNQLSILPLQGRPMAGGHTYAALVFHGDQLTRLDPALVPAAYLDALDRLEELEVDRLALAGLAVFTTADPTAELHEVVAAAAALPIPSPGAFSQTDLLDTYCVYRATVELPVFQGGQAPYSTEGGTWVWDADGPAVQTTALANLDVTIPRSPMPAEGYPLAVMSRTGGGGDRPLVDRGPSTATEERALGAGPALHFAEAGFAGLSMDGPHGGLRNPSGADEQFLMFNIANPGAMRDNVRQSALELALLPAMVATLELDVGDCPGATGPARFDPDHLALMGHSMGATIAPLSLAADVGYGAAILSGAGGSWIHNVVYKRSPLEVRPLAEAMIGYPPGALTTHDPFLGMLQWSGESADPPVYGEQIQAAGIHVLMFQGIVDTYILPPIAHTTALALGLDLAGAPLEAGEPELDGFVTLPEVLPEVGGVVLALPVSGNRDGHTRVVVQHPEDGLEDGHEVMFQLDAAKTQYTHFLRSWLEEGVPEVPAAR